MRTKLLIIGAGPYGLSIAALAKKCHIDFVIAGDPMGFWKYNMPKGMLLRSGIDWHLDADNENTFERYIENHRDDFDITAPVHKEDFIEYANWFIKEAGLEIQNEIITQLDLTEGKFTARMASEKVIVADSVIVAVGVGYFKNTPEELIRNLSERFYSHACETVDFNFLRNKKCLIAGGRQSAFEAAAFMFEAGCEEVNLIYDHPTPAFETSDWSWIDGFVEESLKETGWFNALPKEKKENIRARFWQEGRLKLEPWLPERLMNKNLKLYHENSMESIHENSDGLDVYTQKGEKIPVDYLLFSTGYKVSLRNIPFLTSGNLVNRIKTEDSFPVLNPFFESSVKGLFFVSFPSTLHFGPFCGFVKGAPLTARIIVDHLAGSNTQN